MPFYSFGLNIGRGQIHDTATELNIATHTYKYESDTLAQIAAADYFPDYLGSNSEMVKVNDILIGRGSDGVDTFTITAVSPLTIEPQAEATGNVTGPVSSTLNAVAKYTDTTGKVVGNSGVTIDSSNNITTATGTVNAGGINITGQSVTFGNTTTDLDWIAHTRGVRDVTHWIEADTGNHGGEGYNPAIVMTQDGNNAMARIGMSNDNQFRIDLALDTGSPTSDVVITTHGTVVGGGVIGTMPSITPGTARVTIPGDLLGNISLYPGISLGEVTFTTSAANPGGATTLWVRTSDGHLMFGSTDLTP